MSYFIRLLLSICIVAHCSCQNELPTTDMSKESISRKDFLRGRFDPLDDPNFVIIEHKYADKDSMLMQSEAYEAFLKMAAAGEDDGHSFCILSATRNFAYQKYLWENKWYGIFPINGTIDACTTYPNELTRAKKILEFSAMPGTSRHHWGTDIDINGLDNDYFDKEGKEWYEWMTENASKFGYYQPYTAYSKDRPAGYKEEKWHWTYLPLSLQYTHEAAAIINDQLIDGFAGSEQSDKLDIVKNYILGIHPGCK